jgi:hypothetical protein
MKIAKQASTDKKRKQKESASFYDAGKETKEYGGKVTVCGRGSLTLFILRDGWEEIADLGNDITMPGMGCRVPSHRNTYLAL